MTTVAIVEPLNLFGSELRQALSSDKFEYDDIRVMTFDPSGVGAVTEAGGKPALVQGAESEALAGVDVIFDCGGGQEIPTLLEAMADDSALIVLDPTDIPENSVSVVAGVNSEESLQTSVIVSPDPATILLAHLLQPLADTGLGEVVALILLPASAHGQEGLDELFDQTRAILAMSEDRPQSVFGTQLAFNLLPRMGGGFQVANRISTILRSDASVEVGTIQAGVFHSIAASVFVRTANQGASDDLAARLARSEYLVFADEPETLGPIAAAAGDKIIVAPLLQSAEDSNGHWIWAVMDNLTRGGAFNALDIARYILQNKNQVHRSAVSG